MRFPQGKYPSGQFNFLSETVWSSEVSAAAKGKKRKKKKKKLFILHNLNILMKRIVEWWPNVICMDVN